MIPYLWQSNFLSIELAKFVDLVKQCLVGETGPCVLSHSADAVRVHKFSRGLEVYVRARRFLLLHAC